MNKAKLDTNEPLVKLLTFERTAEAEQISQFLEHQNIRSQMQQDGRETQLFVSEQQYEAALHWLEAETLEEWRIAHPLH